MTANDAFERPSWRTTPSARPPAAQLGSIDEVDVYLDGGQMAEIDATNLVSVSVNYGGWPYASSTASWVRHNNY